MQLTSDIIQLVRDFFHSDDYRISHIFRPQSSALFRFSFLAQPRELVYVCIIQASIDLYIICRLCVDKEDVWRMSKLAANVMMC